MVGKYQVDKTAFVKASVDKKLALGLSYTQKLHDEVSLTLAGAFDLSNPCTGKNSFGASLTFDL